MNNCSYMGRVVQDIKLKKSEKSDFYCHFTVSVRSKKKSIKPKYDYIPCVAWRAVAERIVEFVKKGDYIIVEGETKSRVANLKGGKRINYLQLHVRSTTFLKNRANTEVIGDNIWVDDETIIISDIDDDFLTE